MLTAILSFILSHPVVNLFLSKKAYEGKTIAEMNFTVEDHCMLLRLTRAGMDLPCRPDMQMRRGDILVFSGTKYHLPTLGYVGAYAFANVLLTIAGSIAMRF